MQINRVLVLMYIKKSFFEKSHLLANVDENYIIQI